MKFEEFWTKVSDLKVLPDTAIHQIPSILKDSTKKALATKSPEEAVEIIRSAISEIDRGSVKTVNDLINEKMK